MPHDSIRVVPELRSFDLQQHHDGAPAELLYFDTKYDLSAPPADARRVTLRSAIGRLWSTDARLLELPEPLWLRFWPRQIALAVAFRVGATVRRRPHTVSVYAIENNDFATVLGGRRRLPRWVVRVLGAVIGVATRATVDRICFGSDAARRTYAALPGVAAVPSIVTPELPRPASEAPAGEPGHVTFLGVLEARKGVRLLLDAWERVELARPGARLSVIGSGPLDAEVAAWASARPSSRAAVGAVPHATVGTHLGRASVLVAPSLPDGRWREQIGLPISEGLSLGRTVVTTRQTALAPWLEHHGHHVVDLGPALVERLAAAVVAAIDAPLPVASVRASLPSEHGRLTSDRWLHRVEPTTRRGRSARGRSRRGR